MTEEERKVIEAAERVRRILREMVADPSLTQVQREWALAMLKADEAEA